MNPEKKNDYSKHVIIALLSGIVIVLGIILNFTKEEFYQQRMQTEILNDYIDDVEKILFQDFGEIEKRLQKIENTVSRINKR